MEINKVSNLSINANIIQKEEELNNYLKTLDRDVYNLMLATQNRLRFGSGTDGDNGENISGQFQLFTSDATPDAENTIAHTIRSVPIGYLVLYQDKAGSLYQGPSTGTAWTSSAVYLKCDVASVTFLIFLIK